MWVCSGLAAKSGLGLCRPTESGELLLLKGSTLGPLLSPPTFHPLFINERDSGQGRAMGAQARAHLGWWGL